MSNTELTTKEILQILVDNPNVSWEECLRLFTEAEKRKEQNHKRTYESQKT